MNSWDIRIQFKTFFLPISMIFPFFVKYVCRMRIRIYAIAASFEIDMIKWLLSFKKCELVYSFDV